MAQRYLTGFHDAGGEHLHDGKPGWTTITEAIGLNPQAKGNDYTPISNQGIGVIVRLNNGYGSVGTIPTPEHYQEFAAACQSFVATSKGADLWIIGNEPNHENERPNGVVIMPEEYVRCYIMAANAIKGAKSQSKVAPAGLAPYHASPMKWTDYLNIVLTNLSLTAATRSLVDAIIMHAYTRSIHSLDIFSDEKMGPPLQDTYKGFRTFEDALGQVPAAFKLRPSFITEFDLYGSWPNQNTGVIKQMYAYVNGWNQRAGTQNVEAVTCFRWLVEANDVDWGMANKPLLLQDFSQAVDQGYPSPTIGVEDVEEEHTILLPDIENEKEALPVAERVIDPRLTARGATVIDGTPDANGQVWRLVRADFFPDGNGPGKSGGRHHVYVEFIGEAGEGLVGKPFDLRWADGVTPLAFSNGKFGFDAANIQFSPGENAFTLEVPNGDTLKGIGMGEMTPTGFNPGIHTSTLATYKREVVKKGSPPVNNKPIPSIRILHPVVNPALRIVTQPFGADSAYYSQFKIDEVPLKGHEGIDFGCPPRSLIQAVDDGTVAEKADQGDKGYGRYIKLIHPWGESVYAHLEEQWAEVGDKVRKGDHIGLTGYTGNVDPKGPAGAHLHFGMRVNPYNRQDGWGGYVNPAPYLPVSSIEPTPEPGASLSKKELVKIVVDAANEMGLDWRLLVSLVQAESSFNPLAENLGSGAKGLGQISQGAWSDFAGRLGASNILDPKDNARVSAAYLKWCIEQTGGENLYQALYAYNWGLGNLRENPDGVPTETKEYANKVIHGRDVLELLNP